MVLALRKMGFTGAEIEKMTPAEVDGYCAAFIEMREAPASGAKKYIVRRSGRKNPSTEQKK